MMKQAMGACALAVGILAAAGMARADETGIAAIHDWMKIGRKTCFVDHYHSGSGSGETKRLAEREAIQSWADFTAWEYGTSWSRYSIAVSKTMDCDHSGSWSCFVEARPCRPY